MMSDIREWLLAWQMRRWIKAATKAVYSGQFDADAIVRDIAGNSDNSKLLRAYIAIRVAADTKLVGARPIGRMLEEARYLETEYPDLADDQTVLIRRAEAGLSLKRAEMEFYMEQSAPEFSYTGAVYRAEKNKKGPLSPEERERLKTMTDELAELDNQIEALQETPDEDTDGTGRPGSKRRASEARIIEQGRSSAPDVADNSSADEEASRSEDWVVRRMREIKERCRFPLSDAEKQALREELASLQSVLDAREAQREGKMEEVRVEMEKKLRELDTSGAGQITLPTFREWLALPPNSELEGAPAHEGYLYELKRRYDEGRVVIWFNEEKRRLCEGRTGTHDDSVNPETDGCR